MKKLLIVVDYQNDFINGSLGFEGADSIYPFIKEKIQEYEKSGTIIFLKDTHLPNYLDTMEGKHLPIEHCIYDTEGWLMYGDLEEISKKHRVFTKNTFGSTDLFKFLLENSFDYIELVGLVSNICIISNAVLAKTALPNATIVVDKRGTGSSDSTLHKQALSILKNLHIEVK
jgi:nicotinamidase-related amidase